MHFVKSAFLGKQHLESRCFVEATRPRLSVLIQTVVTTESKDPWIYPVLPGSKDPWMYPVLPGLSCFRLKPERFQNIKYVIDRNAFDCRASSWNPLLALEWRCLQFSSQLRVSFFECTGRTDALSFCRWRSSRLKRCSKGWALAKRDRWYRGLYLLERYLVQR